jgi:hypothetical protein
VWGIVQESRPGGTPVEDETEAMKSLPGGTPPNEGDETEEGLSGGTPLDEEDEMETLEHAVLEAAPEEPAGETPDETEATADVSDESAKGDNVAGGADLGPLCQGALLEETPAPPPKDGVESEVIPVEQAGGAEDEQPAPVCAHRV